MESMYDERSYTSVNYKGNYWVALQCRWYDLVVAAEDDICTIMTVESGKPFKESKAEFVGG